MKIRNLKKTQHSINFRKFTKLTAICISALFIISILSTFSLTSVQAATPVFGNSVIGSYRDQNDANAQSISYFKPTTTGSITDIMAYISGTSSGKATAALYAMNGNSPGSLLAQSSAVNIGTTSSWIDFQLSTTYTVTAGTTYGLAIMGNVRLNLAIVTGTGQRSGGPGYGSYANGFTNPFGTVWFNDVTGAMSIYATGTSSSPPTTTPTPTTNPTQTPVPQSTPPPTQTNTQDLSSFGNSAIGSYRDQNDANAQSISYFKPTTTGSITDIMAYISGTSSGKATAALYAMNGNSPGSLLAQSSAVNIGTTSSWIDFQLSTTYTVTAGTTYGLAIMGNVRLNLAIVTGTGQRSGGPGYGSYANGFTNPFGTVWFNDVTGAMSIYATGTSSSPPTTTPTPTTNPTQTPVPQSTPTPIPVPAPIAGPNLASMPNGWTESITNQRGIGDPTFGSKVIYPVTKGGQTSMKLLAYGAYPYTGTFSSVDREINSAYMRISPGETVVFSAWVWTDSSTYKR